jgi:hypothetical protein
MNMISFANFDNFNKHQSFSRDAETDEKTEDFSAILSNIFVSLQTPPVPAKPAPTDDSSSESNNLFAIASNQSSVAGNDQTDDNLLEIPDAGETPLLPANPDIAPELRAQSPLWAATSPIKQRINSYKSEFKDISPPTPQFNEFFKSNFQYSKIELPPVNSEVKQSDSSDVDIQTPPINPAIGGGGLPPEDFKPEPEPMNVLLKPTFVDHKLVGFDLSPNELHSILGTFEQFLKRPETNITVVAPAGEIATSNPNYQVSELGQTSDFWLNEQVKPDLKNDRAAIKDFSQKLNFFQNPTERTPPTAAQNVKFTPMKFNKFIAAPENHQMTAETDVKNQTGFEENSQNLNYRENDQIEPDLKTDAPENEGAVKFDRIADNFSKEQKIDRAAQNNQTDPAKIAEQINPHLLELAALTDKKNEKQTLKMRLHPAELGTIEIKLERNNAGTLNAFFKTETEGARTALTNNLEQLRDSLQNAGWQIGQMEITSGSFSSTAEQHREKHSRQTESAADPNFSRSSEQPDDMEQNSSNRLLSLLA